MPSEAYPSRSRTSLTTVSKCIPSVPSSTKIAITTMAQMWHSRGFVIGLPRITVLRGPIFAFVIAVCVVTTLICSPRISPAVMVPTTEYVLSSHGHTSPRVVFSNDFKRLIDLTTFDFVFNHFPCIKPFSVNQTSSPLMLLIFIHSNPANFAKRQVIRDTWGSWVYTNHSEITDITMNLIFLLGEVSSKSLQERISVENKVTNDIVQGKFLDSYRNLTYKHVMGLKWCTYYCPEASYVLKTDDDVFVNMPALVRFLTSPRLDNPMKPSADKLILCSRIDNARVKRSFRSKWHVSPGEYPKKFYPTYCMGCAILYSFDVVTQLYQLAQTSPYFWVDDVHITGTLAKLLNLTLMDLGNLMLKQSQVDSIISNAHQESEKRWFSHWKKDSLALGKGKDLFLFGTELSSNDIRKLWRIIVQAEAR